MDPRAILIPVQDVRAGCRIHDAALDLAIDPGQAILTVMTVARPTPSVVAVSVRGTARGCGTVYASLVCGLDDLIAVDVAYWTATQHEDPARHRSEGPRSRMLRTHHTRRPRGPVRPRRNLEESDMRTRQRVRNLERRFDPPDLVGFAVRWQPYGGADASEVLVCFGISLRAYGERLHAALAGSAHGIVMTHQVRDDLIAYADRIRQ